MPLSRSSATIDQDESFSDYYQRFRDGLIDAPYALHHLTLHELLSSPGLSFSDIVDESSGGEVRFEFQLRLPQWSQEVEPIRGWWSSDPGRSWAITSYEVSYPGSYAKFGITTYRDGEPGHPIPDRVRMTCIWNEERSKREVNFEFQQYLVDEIDDHGLSASDYGVAGVPDRPSDTGAISTVAMASLGCLGLCLAFFLRRLSWSRVPGPDEMTRDDEKAYPDDRS